MTFMKLENEGIGIRPFGPVLYCNQISDRMKDEINYHAEHSKIPHNQKKGEWNPSHIHAADFSCVAYTKIPKELKEEWKHPCQRGRCPTAGCVEFTYGEILPASECSYGPIQPTENDIVFFPAWLHHHVYPFHSDVERISFSTNFDLPPDCKYRI